jgi:hypothetical protein
MASDFAYWSKEFGVTGADAKVRDGRQPPKSD